MQRSQRIYCTVRRIVVHDKHLTIDSFEGFADTLQTLIQQLADIIADNDYADFLGHTNGIQSKRITPR